MKKRKLLTPTALSTLTEKVELGVPLSKAIRQMDLDLTRPTALKLVEIYLDYLELDVFHPTAQRIDVSLFAPWMPIEGPAVQEQPDNWYYEGYFPLGEWICRT